MCFVLFLALALKWLTQAPTAPRISQAQEELAARVEARRVAARGKKRKRSQSPERKVKKEMKAKQTARKVGKRDEEQVIEVKAERAAAKTASTGRDRAAEYAREKARKQGAAEQLSALQAQVANLIAGKVEAAPAAVPPGGAGWHAGPPGPMNFIGQQRGWQAMPSPTMGSPAMFGGFKHPGMAPALTPNEQAPAPAATPPVTPESGGEDPKVWACAETLVRAVFDLQHADAQAQTMLVALGGPEGSSSVYIRAFKLLKDSEAKKKK